MNYNNKILIIDDTESIHQDFKSVLSGVSTHAQLDLDSFLNGISKEKGCRVSAYHIDSAFQGEDGFNLVQKAVKQNQPYALILLDVRMPPGWDGIKTASEIWKIAPDTEIVICTAYSDYSWEAILDQLGTSDRLMFLKKPFDAITVKQMVLSQVRKWNLANKSHVMMQRLEDEVAKRTFELNQSMQELEISKNTIESIIDSVNSSLFLIDSNCIVHSINYPAIHYFSIKGTKQSLIGQNLFRLITPDLWRETEAKFIAKLKKLNSNKEDNSFEWEFTTIDNVNRLFLISMSKLHTCDTQYLLVFTDITQKRKEQRYLQRKQRMESVGLLAGGIAHEFNNIIAGIQGYAQLALKTNTNDLYKRGAEVTERQCKRATELVRSLLAFSRTNCIGDKRVDVTSVCEEVLGLTSKNAGAKTIEIVTSFDANAFVEGESGPLQQVIMNLIINAQHAMAESALKRLTIDVKVIDAQVVIKISDTGCGIDKEVLEHVFDPFFTTKGALGGGSVQDKIHGTGLGLSVVVGVVNDFGGSIEVDSQKDKGATFIVKLPYMPDKNRSKRILCISSNQELLHTYSALIKEVDCIALTALSVSEAKNILSTELLDLIMVESILLDENGTDIIKSIRHHRLDIPIILIADIADKMGVQDFRASGVNDCLFQPLNKLKLTRILNQYLKREIVQQSDNVAITNSNLQGKRILIADDEPVVVNVYNAICRRNGMLVTNATNGVEAVELAQSNGFDIILMDIAMPEMDGVMAIKKIKQYLPYIPIIVCTGFLTDSHKEAYQAGALKVLNKPVGVKDLIAIISEVLCQ